MKTLIQSLLLLLVTLISLSASQLAYAASPLFGIWNGTLSNERGEIPFELAISRNGHYISGHEDNGAFHAVEFTKVGQKISYVPTGGGIGEIRVAYLDERATGMTVIVEERTQQLSPRGFLNETHATIGTDINLGDQGLQTLLVINSENNTEETGFTSGSIVLTGILQEDVEFAKQHGSDSGQNGFIEDSVADAFIKEGLPLPDGLFTPVF